MNEIEIFYQDKDECRIPFSHISEAVTDPSLKALDEYYGAADVLSVYNARKHGRILLGLSAAGTLLTLAFLLYDEAELHGLILACGAMIVCLFAMRRLAGRLDCHRKYLQYRVLAECLRCQFYLSAAALKTRVSDLLPWFIRRGIPWISEFLNTVPDKASVKKQSVLDLWIRDQKKYHESALKKAELKNRKDGLVTKTVLIITITAYVAVLLYELFLYHHIADAGNADLIRALLKILLGTMSAATLFTGSYYGKMSLPNEIEDHKRMIALYEAAEEDILQNGENDAALLSLAREFLNENSTWYAYQSNNTADITL